MSDFETDLDKFNLNIQSILNSYDGLDQNSPITSSIIDDVRKIVDENYHYVCDNLLRLNKVIDANASNFQQDLIDHNKKVNELGKEYQKQVSFATQDIQSQIDTKKQNIKDAHIFNRNKNDELNDDTDSFIKSSALNIEMLRNEAKNDIAKYTYQYNEAKYTYAEDAEQYNEETFKKLDDIKNSHNKMESSFHNQIDSVIRNYVSILEKINTDLEELRSKHALDIKKLSDEKRNLSIELNNQIKILNQEHSEVTNNAKKEYQNTQKQLLEERSNKKNEYLKQTQDSNKEFITSTEENLRIYNEQKASYNEGYDELIENNYYDLFLSHKEEEDKIKNYYASSSTDKSVIKNIEKEYHNYYLQLKKETQNELKALEKEFNKKTQEYMINKAKIDSLRQAAIKKYTENELRDNKYYQEKNNEADALSDYLVAIDSFEINKKINMIRHDSNIKLYNLEAKIDINEANYLKDNEMLLTEKRKCNLEIEASYKLKELLSNMLQKKYNKEVMYLRITGALYIERCKKLLEYNERQLDIYSNISNDLFEYSKKKIELQNEQRRAINECKANINSIILDITIMNINNDISILGNKEKYESMKLFKEFTFKREQLINETLNKRFEYEIRNINHHTSSLLIIIDALEDILVNSIDYIVKNVNLDISTFNFIIKFIDKIKDEVFAFSKITLENYKKVMLELIEDTIKFENMFKFEVSFNSSNDHFYEENLRINNNINDTVKRIEALKQEIDKENKSIQNLYFGLKNDKSASKTDLSNQIQTLKKDISNKNKLLKGYNESIKRLNIELKDLAIRHDREIKDITSMQKANTVSLYKLNSMVTDLTSKIINGLDEKISAVNKMDMKYDNYRNILNDKYSIIKSYLIDCYKSIYEMIHNFKEESIKYHLAGEDTLDRSYSYSIKELDFENIRNLRNQNQRFVQEYSSKNRDLNIAKKKESNTMHLYNTYNKRLDNSYASDNKGKNLLLQKNEVQLYRELNAINQNIIDIKKDYEVYISDVENAYKATREAYFNEAQEKKASFDSNLKEYIIQRDNDIKRLPNAIKERVLQSSFDLKDRNKEIDYSITEENDNYISKKKKSKTQIDSIIQNYNKSILEIEKEQREYIKKAKNLRKA